MKSNNLFTILSQQPLVVLGDSGLSDEQINFLATLNIHEPSGVGHIFNTDINEFRTSKSLYNTTGPEFIDIQKHIISILFKNFDDFYSLNHCENIQMTKYEENDYFNEHLDFHNQDRNNLAVERDRIATVLIYINDDFEGGHTTFPLLGLDIKPKKGQMLYFKYPVEEPLETNLKTRHEGSKVIKGNKIILTQWFLEDYKW